MRGRLSGLRHRGLLAAALMASACAASTSTSAAAAGLECAPRPGDPVGYQVRAVHADVVEAPPTTPPIAVLDSGVAQVPELSGRLLEGFNVLTGGRNTADTDGHGTAVAAIAAARAGGVRGISPTSPILPVKIFDSRGETRADWVIQGIRRAVASGARVINLSAAAPATGADRAANRAVQSAIFKAVTSGVLVIVPTGNEGAEHLDIPAAFPHVIAVGATDEGGLKASFSNSGAGIDLVAPGAGITTAAPSVVCSSGYAFVSGTSFSAPAVAGAAALLLQKHPGLDPTQVTDMIRLRGRPSPQPGWNSGTGFGALDVPAVLSAPVPRPDAPEVDDTPAWADLHAAVLSPTQRSTTVDGRVSRRIDPSDVFRVRLKRGDRLKAALSAAGRELHLWIASASRVLVKAKTGSVSLVAKKSGVYYVSVSAASASPAGKDYKLKLRR